MLTLCCLADSLHSICPACSTCDMACRMPLAHAVSQCMALGIAFVAPFYLKGRTARNHPSTVKFRMLTTACTSLLAWLPLRYQLYKIHSPRHLLLPLLGLRAQGLLRATLYPTLLTATLFAGPLVQLLLTGKSDQPAMSILQALRNLLLAPITEEFCFRACMAPLFLLQGCSYVQAVLLTPLMFGVAHVHHVFEMVKFQDVKLTAAVAQACFQFAYTTLFGWYATHIFLSTGHIAGAVAVHTFCNCMGFPAVGELMHHPRKTMLLSVYFMGIVAFVLLFPAWTQSDQYSSDYMGLVAKAKAQ